MSVGDAKNGWSIFCTTHGVLGFFDRTFSWMELVEAVGTRPPRWV